MRKLLLCLISILLLLTGCQNDTGEEEKIIDETEMVLKDCAISQDSKYGSAYVEMGMEDFMALGIEIGDSVNVYFSNGSSLLDIPVFDGYYTRYGQPLIAVIPGNKKAKIARNNAGVWEEEGLNEDTTVSIAIEEKGKYLEVEKLFQMVYSLERDDYESDEEFANYRNAATGQIKEGRIYRGASSLNNESNRAEYVNMLIQRDGISFVLDLADKEEEIDERFEENSFDMSAIKKIYAEGGLAALGLSANYRKSSFKESLGEGLKKMAVSKGPYYVHCTEGKDRAGFVMLLIEALCGSSFEEMEDDYMLSFKNYYGITKEDKRYALIVEYNFIPFLTYLTNEEDVEVLKSMDFKDAARNYLHECAMNDEEIDWLIDSLVE